MTENPLEEQLSSNRDEDSEIFHSISSADATVTTDSQQHLTGTQTSEIHTITDVQEDSDQELEVESILDKKVKNKVNDNT